MFIAALQLLWMFAPMFVANAAPVVLAKLPGLSAWDTPMHERWLGSHKTWRGFLLSPIIAALIGALEMSVREFFPVLAALPGPDLGTPILSGAVSGFLLGLGAMVGDVVKSFLKRRIGIRPGDAWPVIDGIDYVVGALLFVSPWFRPSIWSVLFLCFVGPLASLLANIFSFFIGWKKVWW